MKDIEEIINNNEIEKLTYSIVSKDLNFIKLRQSKCYYLIYAIESNCSIDMIKLLLPIFSSLDYEYDKKFPFYVAVENNKFDVADLLLKEGANINSLNSDKENILFYLHNKKKLNKSKLKYILSKNIDINYKVNNLHFIEYLLNNNNENTKDKINSTERNEKKYELVKTIFETLTFKNEFIINLIYLYKRNALKMSYIKEKMETENKIIEINKSMYNLAIKNNNKKVIELLLKYDNKEKVFKRKKGYELLLTACKYRNYSIVKSLIESGVNINEIDSNGVNALMIASQAGNLNIIKLLIENKIEINERDDENRNALLYAVDMGYLEIVQYLVQNKININVCSLRNGWNALFYAICRNYKEIAMYLIDNDIDIYGNNFENNNSKSIFTFAYKRKNIDLIKYMIEKGINPDGKHYLGDTILMRACENNDIEMVNFLIENGVDIDAVNGEKETALIYAIRKNNLKVVQLLVEKGINIHLKDCDGYTAFLYASETSTLDIVKYLISKGADIKDKNNSGWNALILACWADKFEIVKYLIECGIDINETTNQGGNALTVSIGYANIEIIKYLVNNGIDINHTTKSRFNAAFSCINTNSPEELKYLVEKGIDINYKNCDGLNAIEYAKTENQEMYNYLKKKEIELKEIELKKIELRNMELRKKWEATNKFSFGSSVKKFLLR